MSSRQRNKRQGGNIIKLKKWEKLQFISAQC